MIAEFNREEGLKLKKVIIITILSTILVITIYKIFLPTQTSEIYSGESETWKVGNVKINTDEHLNISDSKIYMKNENEYLADYFKLSFHVVIKNIPKRESRIHEYELDADNLPVLWEDDFLDISEMDTGDSSPIYLTNFGKPVTINDIKQVYIDVQWKGENDNKLEEEKIILTPTDI